MIQFLSTGHDYTLKAFLEGYGQALAPHFEILSYGQFFRRERHPKHAAYIFSDLERVVNARNLRILRETWNQLVALPEAPRLLNSPERVLKRLDLLNILHAKGINEFKAYPIGPKQIPQPQRFPVFIREANDHAGNLSPLLQTQTELEEAVQKLRKAGKLTGCPIVTEFIPVQDQRGYYRKYGAFRIGDEIIAGHLLADKHWMLKGGNLGEVHDWIFEEDYDYVYTNPHVEQLKPIFELAGIDYGRIDYGLYQGRIQVFEINTNPVLLRPRYYPQYPLFQKRLDLLSDKLQAALRTLLSA